MREIVMTRLAAILMTTLLATPAFAESKISFLVAQRGDPFQDLIVTAVSGAAQSDPTLSVSVENADKDPARQIALGQAAIAAKAAALMIIPVSTESAAILAEAAGKAGVPLVFVNNRPQIGPSGGKAVFVSSNDLVAGRVQMRLIVDKLGGQGTVAILRGTDTETASVERTAGGKEILASSPGITLVSEASANWKRQEAQEQVAAWLKGGRKIDAIAANNDEMALGAIAAIKAAGLSGRILVGGVDATKEGVAAVGSGDMLLSVYQDARMQGSQALADAGKLSKGEYVQRYDWVPFELVIAENAQHYSAR
ncbi:MULTISPECIES: substrate-binding domain-containing protein [Methylobacterium]|nr:hypothetical protein [Methylobacterium bullatum]